MTGHGESRDRLFGPPRYLVAMFGSLALFLVGGLVLGVGVAGKAPLIVVGAVVLLLAGVFLIGWSWYGRMTKVGPFAGSNRSGRKAAMQALKDGHSDDPHIDAMARASAERILRLDWLRWIWPAGLLLTVVSGIGNVTDRHVNWLLFASQCIQLVIYPIMFVLVTLQVRRAKRYLAR